MPSTVIQKIDYEPETKTLWVTFVPSGRRYAYARVPLDVYDAFRTAFSKGSFFNRHIRDQFDAEIIDEGA